MTGVVLVTWCVSVWDISGLRPWRGNRQREQPYQDVRFHDPSSGGVFTLSQKVGHITDIQLRWPSAEATRSGQVGGLGRLQGGLARMTVSGMDT